MIDHGFIKDIDAAADIEVVKSIIKEKYGVDDVMTLKQVHGDDILINESGQADGIIITKTGFAGVVRTADCFPVVLSDEKAGVIGVFHCGWRGTELGIHIWGFKKMKELGCKNIEAVIFPGIEKCCFEIGFELKDRFKKANIPLEVRDGKLYADIRKKLENDLNEIGVKKVSSHTDCTYCGQGYFSYRKDGTKNRHATFIVNFS